MDIKRIRINRDKVNSGVDNVLNEVATIGIEDRDMDLLSRILNDIARCYSYKIDEYIDYCQRDQFDEINKSNFDWSEGRRENRLSEPNINECVKGIGNGLPEGLSEDINFFPSDKKGVCRPQCVVVSHGDWDFGDTKLRNDILSYWYRCFYTNRFTLVFTEAWQPTHWNKWKKLIDGYVAEQQFEIKGQVENIDHTVVIIEYSNNGVQLRYVERSI